MPKLKDAAKCAKKTLSGIILVTNFSNGIDMNKEQIAKDITNAPNILLKIVEAKMLKAHKHPQNNSIIM